MRDLEIIETEINKCQLQIAELRDELREAQYAAFGARPGDVIQTRQGKMKIAEITFLRFGGLTGTIFGYKQKKDGGWYLQSCYLGSFAADEIKELKCTT